MTRRSLKRTRKNSRSMKRRDSKKMYKQRGGTEFSEEQRAELMDLGFTEEQITELSQLLGNMDADYAINYIKISLQQNNQNTGQPNTPQEIIDSLQPDDPEDDIISEIGSDDNSEQHNMSDDSINLNDSDINILNNSYNSDSDNSGVTTLADESDGSLHLSELEGGKLKKRRTRKSRKGKSRKSRKGKSRKMRGRKQRGGARYGTGVGANNSDPNYSIYNTPALTLFPYKPN